MAKKKTKRGRTVILVVVLALVIYFSISFFNEWSTLARLEDNKLHMQSELGKIEDNNDSLKEDIDFSGTPAFIERMAREIFGMVKEGEKRYVDEDEG